MANIMRLGGGNSKVKIVNVGTITLNTTTGYGYSGTISTTLDIKSKIPNYSKLTADNIVFGVTYCQHRDKDTSIQNQMSKVFYEYDANTGIITVKANWNYTNAYRACGFKSDVFVIEGNVERI